MLDKLSVRTFKSLEDVTVDLGRVNVFVGANGSGKSNLLEALGILSAAADGKVDDQALLARGVRPGLPALYKSAFPVKRGKRVPPHLRFGARSGRAKYEVSLHNPLNNPAPAWRFNFAWTSSNRLPLSPSAAASRDAIRFRDRFMRKDQNVLSGYDASEGALYALFLAVVSGHEASPALCAVDNADHGLNPRLVRSLMEYLSQWYLDSKEPRQILLTTHNPVVLDGLPLQDDRVRLFTVSRTSSGRTSVRRVVVDGSLLKKAEQGWTLSRLWVRGDLGGVPNV